MLLLYNVKPLVNKINRQRAYFLGQSIVKKGWDMFFTVGSQGLEGGRWIKLFHK